MTGPTERCWLCDTLAVTLTRVDFLDPALADQPDVRERGVRVEIRPARPDAPGSLYSSPTLVLGPAVCRIDLLESAPGAADRMHWHPAMTEGEPEDRVFDPAMPHDPEGWLTDRLADVGGLLERSGALDAGRHERSVALVAEVAEEIVRAAVEGLRWARSPWPEVGRDERGMARADGVPPG